MTKNADDFGKAVSLEDIEELKGFLLTMRRGQETEEIMHHFEAEGCIYH